MRIGNGLTALGWSIALAGQALPAAAAGTAGVSPTWVESRHPSTLILSIESDQCALMFTHNSARLTAGKLVLSVLEQQRAGIACTNAPSWAYHIEFDAPALDSGVYPIQLRWAKPCEFDGTPCTPPDPAQDLGQDLRVSDSAALPYSITPRAARGGEAFHIRLHGNFNCGDQIKASSVDTARPVLRLNFTIEPHPEVICIAPFPGIDFAVPPLMAGGWQAMVYRSPYCPSGSVCPLALMAPQLAGAVEVSAGVEAVVPFRPGSYARPAGMGRPGFRSEWNGRFRDAAGKAIRP